MFHCGHCGAATRTLGAYLAHGCAVPLLARLAAAIRAGEPEDVTVLFDLLCAPSRRRYRGSDVALCRPAKGGA